MWLLIPKKVKCLLFRVKGYYLSWLYKKVNIVGQILAHSCCLTSLCLKSQGYNKYINQNFLCKQQRLTSDLFISFMFFCKDPDTEKTEYKFLYPWLLRAMLLEKAAPCANALCVPWHRIGTECTWRRQSLNHIIDVLLKNEDSIKETGASFPVYCIILLKRIYSLRNLMILLCMN